MEQGCSGQIEQLSTAHAWLFQLRLSYQGVQESQHVGFSSQRLFIMVPPSQQPTLVSFLARHQGLTLGAREGALGTMEGQGACSLRKKKGFFLAWCRSTRQRVVSVQFICVPLSYADGLEWDICLA